MLKLRSSPANVYFHVQVNNPFYTAFGCVQRKMLTFQLRRVQVHADVIDHFSSTHEVLLCQLNVSVMIFYKGVSEKVKPWKIVCKRAPD